MIKNKHVFTAGLVAPVLALIAYFSMDFFIGETPHVAKKGTSYLLVEKPNCRYSSGSCGLKNGDFELILEVAPLDDEQAVLTLNSVFPLEGAKVALVLNQEPEAQPADMTRASDNGLLWSLQIPRPDPDEHRLHVVAAANQTLYYGDVSMKFTGDDAGY